MQTVIHKALFKWRQYRRESAFLRFRKFCLALTRVYSKPVFVKVGAHDGITDDPCSDILLQNTNWVGLLIEPVPDYFERLKRNFSDSKRFCLRQVAIGSHAQEKNFYYVDSKAKEWIHDLPSWFDQLGSFDRGHILKHLNGTLEPFIRCEKVQVCSLTDALCQASVQEVHLLLIDTEGHDLEVLKTLDFRKHLPFCIYIEHKHLLEPKKAEMLRILGSNGYSVHDCGDDFFAVRKQARKLLRQAPTDATFH